mgnify:CR=1 FL=1|tara:strand:+ start:3822 stop:4961 length:1140 start_codon:yes stop_codon:yes gene_type:complete
MKRRKFLLTFSFGLGLIGLYLPRIFNSSKNNLNATFNGKRFIIIHLDGGNDGLFTMAPKDNDTINKQRKSLIKELSSGIKLNGDFLINKHLGDFVNLLSKGWLSIIPNVGYPEPNTSHFVSSEIWETGSLPSEGLIRRSWLGNLIEKNRLDRDLLENAAISFESGRHLIFQADTNVGVSYSKDNTTSTLNRELNALVYENADYYKEYQGMYKELKTQLNLSNLISDIEPLNGYPNTALGQKLATISSMIKKQKPFKLFHIKHGGYDTHLGQIHRLNNLYNDLGGCLKIFAHDLNQMAEWMNTQVLIYSEFGRSIDENTNGGTDHGTAGPVFVLGGEQIYGRLTEIKPIYETYNIIDKPYLKYQIDFRDIFNKAKENWLT